MKRSLVITVNDQTQAINFSCVGGLFTSHEIISLANLMRRKKTEIATAFRKSTKEQGRELLDIEAQANE